MSDYLPDMIEPPPAPTAPEPAPDANVHIPDNIQDKLEDNQNDAYDIEDDNIQMELMDEEEDLDELIQTRPKMSNEDIFKGPKIQPVKMSKEEKAEQRRIVREAAKAAEKERKLQEKEAKKLAKQQEKEKLKALRPKKQMSPAHLEKLQAGRLKAQETRARNKLLREQGADIPKPLTKKEKELKNVVESVIEPRKPQNQLSKSDLEEAQFNAIMRYEEIRKKRKTEKQKKQKEEQILQQSQASIHRAVNPHPQKDVWDMALGGMFS